MRNGLGDRSPAVDHTSEEELSNRNAKGTAMDAMTRDCLFKERLRLLHLTPFSRDSTEVHDRKGDAKLAMNLLP